MNNLSCRRTYSKFSFVFFLTALAACLGFLPSAHAKKAVVEETDIVKEQVVIQEQSTSASAASTSAEDSLASEASKDFSGGFKTVGHGFSKGAKVTGGAFKKAGTTVGHTFKKVGVAIKNFFTGKRGSDSNVEEQDLKSAQNGAFGGEATSQYVPASDLDAVGNDPKSLAKKPQKSLVKEASDTGSAMN